jgi:tetratricopeptide (TPR) repeat protein
LVAAAGRLLSLRLVRAEIMWQNMVEMSRRNAKLLLCAAWMLAATFALAQGDQLRKALSLMKAGRPIEAEETLCAIGGNDRDYTAARALTGFLLLRRAALPEAEQSFRQALKRESGSAAARFGLGFILLRKGAFNEASALLAGAVADPVVGERARAEWIRSLFLSGQEEEALRSARELAANHPSAAEYRGILGFLYQARGDHRQSIAEYRQALAADPWNLSYYFSLISLLQLERNWKEALHWTRQALALDENHPLLYQKLAESYERLGDAQQAADAREEARRTFEGEALYLQSVRARRAHSDSEAVQSLREALRVNPRLAKAWIGLGEFLRQEGRLGEAYDAFISALELEPENSGAHLNLADVLRAQGRDAEALEVYNRALARGVVSADILSGMASAYLLQGKAPEAAEAMLRAVEALPDDPDLLSYLGYIQESAGRKSEALTSYSQALRLNSFQSEARFGRANHLLDTGDPAHAADEFAGITGASPQHLPAWYGSIRAYRQIGNTEAAVSACLGCLRHHPDDPGCREQLAFLHLHSSRFPEAAAEFETLLRNGKSNKSIIDGLAFAHLRMASYSQAAGLFESSLRRYGADAWVESNLGFLCRCLGDLTAAVGHYRRACELDSGHADNHYDLALALHLSGDFKAAAAELQAALRLRPGWGSAHYNLAMAFWNLRQYGPALSHARLAEQKGVPEARHIAATLASRFSRAGKR